MTQATSPHADDRIEELLTLGLALYRRGQVERAISSWRRVLSLAPHEPRAMDYLRSAGAAKMSASRGSGVRPAVSMDAHAAGGSAVVDRPLLERLLQERRYEEALSLLQEGASRAPDDHAIARGIEAIREHLVVRFGRRVEGLDKVPILTGGASRGEELDTRRRAVLACVDGRATFADILATSPLGRFDTCRVLAELLDEEWLAVTPGAPPASAFDELRASLFARATTAYLDGDHAAAERLYEECLVLSPGDALAAHNLDRLRARPR